jgi:hypothetical protein
MFPAALPGGMDFAGEIYCDHLLIRPRNSAGGSPQVAGSALAKIEGIRLVAIRI